MATYIIHPIALGEGIRDCSQYTYRMNFGTTCKAACYIWYLEGSQPKTIVDAGATAAMFRERGMVQEDYISAEEGLNKLGLKPDDIEIVVVSHLHWDHMALSHLYKKAKFIVQKKELDYALNPHPLDKASFDRSMFEDLNFEVVDGEKEILPGVTVFLTPGHTPGGQSVEINTAAGKAIITGFCYAFSTFTQNETMKHKGWEVPVPLVHQDVRDVYDSVLEVRRRADIFLGLHDPAFVGRETIP
ncbi:N-acyl homoserine lactonase family protein [Chloroflexota bacterium]